MEKPEWKGKWSQRTEEKGPCLGGVKLADCQRHREVELVGAVGLRGVQAGGGGRESSKMGS